MRDEYYITAPQVAGVTYIPTVRHLIFPQVSYLTRIYIVMTLTRMCHEMNILPFTGVLGLQVLYTRTFTWFAHFVAYCLGTNLDFYELAGQWLPWRKPRDSVREL